MQKEKVQQVVSAMPDDVDVDKLMDELYLLEKIEIAERQLAAGEGISHEEAKRRLATAVVPS